MRSVVKVKDAGFWLLLQACAMVLPLLDLPEALQQEVAEKVPDATTVGRLAQASQLCKRLLQARLAALKEQRRLAEQASQARDAIESAIQSCHASSRSRKAASSMAASCITQQWEPLRATALCAFQTNAASFLPCSTTSETSTRGRVWRHVRHV